MAAWKTTSEEEFEKANVEKLGREEYDKRLATADAKADQLKDWEERMFMAAQFRSIVMRLSAAQFETMEKLPGDRWSRLVYKLAAK